MPVLSSSAAVSGIPSPKEVTQFPSQDDLEWAVDHGRRLELTLVVGYDFGRVIDITEDGIVLEAKPVTTAVRLAISDTDPIHLLPGDNGFVIVFEGVCEHGVRYRVTINEGEQKATYVVVTN